MRKFLPIFFLFLLIGLLSPKATANAQSVPNQQIQQGPTAPDGSWVIDPEVTFIGKNAARSGDLLNFTLQNYGWVCISKSASGQCDNSGNPLTAVWLKTVTYIVVPLLFIVMLVTAIVIIVTRGKSLTIMRFLPRFVAIILLIFFSFAIIQFFYQFGDVIQGFFLRPPNSTESCPPKCISNANLLYVQWDYAKFEGLRKVGNVNSESAFITLLLTKLTALTYFVMVGLLYLRRIILWLFIIVSPVFPILLLFYPVRNTGKIWVGEFFRWLLYAPLFAIFLQGLVFLWQPGVTGRINNIPLVFENTADKGKEIYPTAVNILLGAPGEKVDLTNSVNIKETFAEYVVSLLMLWGVIILPWILLQIFLDYAQNIGVGDSAVMKNMMNIINRQGPPGAPAPHSPTSGGSAISLPFSKKFSMPNPPSAPTGIAMEIPVSAASRYSTTYMPSAQVKAQVLTLTNMSLPSMRDIAKYDTSLISRDSSRQKEAITIRDNLVKIGNPASSSTTSDKERYSEIREKLIKESTNGNTLATSILTAANTASKRSSTATTSQIKSMLTQIANPQAASSTGSSSVINREKLSKMNESLIQAKKEGNTLATAILSVSEKTPTIEIEKLQEKIRIAKEKGEPVATQIAAAMEKRDVIPVANRVQTVSKEDYQAVKDMWKENYKNLEVPEGMAGTRTEWVKDDISKIDNIISLMDSKDEEKISKGMEEVSSILPFLLVGGFSQSEIVSYLKAKQDAAKEVVASLDQDEEDKVSISVKRTATATGQMSASISDDYKGVDANNHESSFSNLSRVSTDTSIKHVSDEIFSLVDIKLPSIRDIARYEALYISKDKSKTTEVEKANEILKNIANPESITSATDKQRYEKVKEKLLDESSKGNIIATAILSASNGINTSSISKVQTSTKDVLSQIANPSLVAKETDKKRFTFLHDELSKASKEGSTLATSLLTVKDNVTKEELENLTTQLNEEKIKGNTLATSVLSNITGHVSLPSTNRIQNVSAEDYKAVKDMWIENYQGLEVPTELAATRVEWVKQDIEKMGNVVSMLSSSDQERNSKGMEEVSSILPFLLVGGFSQTEIISYLNAKQEAASEVLTSIIQEEESKISISSKKSATNQQIMSVSREAVIASNVIPQQSTVSNVASKIVLPQESAEILKLANLQLPNLRDIASFEMRSLTKDKTESERVEKIHQVLERLNNPQKLTSRQDQQQYEELRERLAAESLNGNVTADIILSAVSQLAKTAGQIDATLSDVKTVLLQIVNSSSIADVDDRDYYTRLHEYLETESKQKNNTVAQSILTVNDRIKLADIQNIKEQLNTDNIAGSPVLPQLTNAVNDFSKAKLLRSVISQVLSPENIKSQSDKQVFTNIRKTIDEANKKGDTLAASLLSVTPKTSEVALTQLHKRLADANKKGDPTAKAILSKVSEPFAMSSSNRLQNVLPEEYKEAMDMWRKAYTQYLVPSDFTEDTKGRSEWINSDISDMEQTIGLLQSSEVEKREEGIKKVSSILPFLLLGGFSYDEMNTYLKSKLAAARLALTQIQEEEGNKISVNVQNTKVVERKFSAELPQGSVEDDSAAPVNFVKKDIIIPQGANEILSLVDIKLPTIQDVARYDSEFFSKGKSKSMESDKIYATLEKITNPAVVSVAEEREKYQKLQERLILESQKENSVAASVLTAATIISQNNINTPTTNQIKDVFSQIIYPELVDSSQDRKRLEELRNMLSKDAHDNSNKLATQILSVNEKSTVPELEKIREQLIKARNEGSSIASSVIFSINKSIFDSQVTQQVKSLLLRIANPDLITEQSEKDQYSKVHESLVGEIQQHDNQLAKSILNVTESTSDMEIRTINQQIEREGKDLVITEVKNIIQKKMISTRPNEVTLPAANHIQEVSKEDYAAVKNIWSESYKTLEVPLSLSTNRQEWITSDISTIDSVIGKLSSNDQEQKIKGMDEVSDILPFLLIGGFSQEEILEYLKSKKEAGEEVLSSLNQEEEESAELSVRKNEKVNTNVKSEEMPDGEEKQK